MGRMIRTELETIFAIGRDERFEDGMESMFSRALVAYIGEQGETALKELSTYVFHERVNAEVAGESLRWVGGLENSDTHNSWKVKKHWHSLIDPYINRRWLCALE